ncbi:MAG: Maf family nucleotide pyrophosphatase [Alphaproteobacteria bacterium]|nr:Maf family nucleotide pyrophosphatase [Alphaproteobacteria bacterium]
MDRRPRLILASRSKARIAMLQAAGLDFATIPADLDEDGLLAAFSGNANAAALMLAQQKALHVSRMHPDALVIGSDSMALFEGEMLQKADTNEQALQRLQRMAGKDHQIISAVCVARAGAALWTHVQATTLTFHPFDAVFLQHYARAAKDALTGCAGGYTLEGPGAWLFSKVDGDYFTVLGLPLLPLLAYLRTQQEFAP